MDDVSMQLLFNFVIGIFIAIVILPTQSLQRY